MSDPADDLPPAPLGSPAPALPARGGCYEFDPATGELTPTDQTPE